ncbi:hypothetical protein SNEBB_008508 [Seison nebaliae]|nr:hypothetical protein SNEBB_008508 [Seison nebaliae]
MSILKFLVNINLTMINYRGDLCHIFRPFNLRYCFRSHEGTLLNKNSRLWMFILIKCQIVYFYIFIDEIDGSGINGK